MKRIIVSCTVVSALFAGGFAIADDNGPGTTGFAGTVGHTTGTSGAPTGKIDPGGSGSVGRPNGPDGAPGAKPSASGTGSNSTDKTNRELKDCLTRKKSGDHSMSASDREQACRAEMLENAS